MAAEIVPRNYTVDEYHRIAGAGIFDGERVELLDGVVVRMPPIGVAHWSRHGRIVSYLSRALQPHAQVQGQISLPLGDRNEPEPDIAVLANLPYERMDRPPEIGEIYATIEISDSSLSKDLHTKRLLYARFQIADYFVVDLKADALSHFSRPAGGDYTSTRSLGYAKPFRLASLPDIELTSDAFLPEL